MTEQEKRIKAKGLIDQIDESGLDYTLRALAEIIDYYDEENPLKRELSKMASVAQKVGKSVDFFIERFKQGLKDAEDNVDIKRIPAEVFPVSDFIKEELKSHGWTEIELADLMGRDLSSVRQILDNRVVITRQIAGELSRVFGTSDQYWMNLDRAYLDHMGRKLNTAG